MSEEYTAMTEEDLREKSAQVCTVAVPHTHMNMAERFIEKMREYHRSIGDVFVGYTCACDSSGGTKWLFGYNSEDAEATQAEIKEVFMSVFEEVYLKQLEEMNPIDRMLHQMGEASIAANMSPCQCPFSMK